MAYLQGGGRDYGNDYLNNEMKVGTTTPGQLRQDMKPAVKPVPVELGNPAEKPVAYNQMQIDPAHTSYANNLNYANNAMNAANNKGVYLNDADERDAMGYASAPVPQGYQLSPDQMSQRKALHGYYGKEYTPYNQPVAQPTSMGTKVQ